ncbi:MAG: urate hydroxylase PuuD [Elusimicrobiota bacterium]
MLSDLFSNFNLLFRWIHVISGIVWVGHLYFFNFVNLQLQASIDDVTKKAVNPQLMPRALWWFRWGAMSTFISGLILFTMIYMYTPGVGFGPSNTFSSYEGITGRAIWILMGMTLGSIMWFNVWFIIWPTQKLILGGKAPADQLPALRTKAAKFSRINTFLSGPMLFGMLAAPHYGSASFLSMLIVISIAMLAVSAAYKASKNVGKTI